MKLSKPFLASGIVAALVVGAAVVYVLRAQPEVEEPSAAPTTEALQEEQTSEREASCLGDDEEASYELTNRDNAEDSARIIVKGKATGAVKREFRIPISSATHYHPLELHKCGVYAVRTFGYDFSTKNLLQDYRRELWRYRYDGRGESLMRDPARLSHENVLGDFRIDPNERYLVLEKSYLGSADYALIVKNLATLDDLLVLNLRDVVKQHLDVVPGSIGLGKWSEDGKRLFGDFFQGALSTAYYIVEAGAWDVDIYAAPDDIVAGVERAINFQNLHLAYVDIPTFVGFQEVYEQIIEQAKKEGRQKNLFMYDLRTKEKVKIASADPEWRFNIKWLSDTELEYFLPDGERRIYMIPG